MLLGIAADQGSQAAAYLLGNYFADGSHGFPQDFELARSWYTKVVAANEVDIGVEDVLKVARWLRHNPAA
jgi:TPR repeat protein